MVCLAEWLCLQVVDKPVHNLGLKQNGGLKAAIRLDPTFSPDFDVR